MKILAGDIGGTKTLLMLADVSDDRLTALARERYASADYPDLAPMVRAFLSDAGLPRDNIDAACFALAGPVARAQGVERARLTNLPWELESTRLAQDLGIPRVALLNDFEGIGHSLDDLPAEALHTLQAGRAEPDGVRLVVGAGTGLGVCIVPPGQPLQVLPTESGHADFAPANAAQDRLWQYVTDLDGRCSREHLLSGRGLGRVAGFLVAQGQSPGQTLSQALEGDDPAPVISQLALEGSDPVAVEAMDLFLAVYGGQTGDLALGCLPFGGVFIAGGIAPRLLPRMREGGFIEAFRSKPPMTHLLERMPVQVIGDTDAGLLGAARHAASLCRGLDGAAWRS
ncbi:glucokinase [Ectothiorhodospira haloalkaliphila]|uniref:Glucokinase n=1 Tax=Ectothiorhodospira haloalkaliphila TaxID=421628 RepID=W8KS07_9GAMM|nr:glucokinase [Ectothiorhodospira haloalkaliphila]AHK78361.1 glucokinase [Ectothiorhodospira haloalkaliphila]